MKYLFLLILSALFFISCSEDDNGIDTSHMRTPSDGIIPFNDKYKIFYGYAESVIAPYNDICYEDKKTGEGRMMSVNYQIAGIWGGIYNYLTEYDIMEVISEDHDSCLIGKEPTSHYWRNIDYSTKDTIILGDTLYSVYYSEAKDFYYDGTLVLSENIKMCKASCMGYTLEALDITYSKNDTTYNVVLVPGLAKTKESVYYNDKLVKEENIKLLNINYLSLFNK